MSNDLILIPTKVDAVCTFDCGIQCQMGSQQIIRHLISLIKVANPLTAVPFTHIQHLLSAGLNLRIGSFRNRRPNKRIIHEIFRVSIVTLEASPNHTNPDIMEL